MTKALRLSLLRANSWRISSTWLLHRSLPSNQRQPALMWQARSSQDVFFLLAQPKAIIQRRSTAAAQSRALEKALKEHFPLRIGYRIHSRILIDNLSRHLHLHTPSQVFHLAVQAGFWSQHLEVHNRRNVPWALAGHVSNRYCLQSLPGRRALRWNRQRIFQILQLIRRWVSYIINVATKKSSLLTFVEYSATSKWSLLVVLSVQWNITAGLTVLNVAGIGAAAVRETKWRTDSESSLVSTKDLHCDSMDCPCCFLCGQIKHKKMFYVSVQLPNCNNIVTS